MTQLSKTAQEIDDFLQGNPDDSTAIALKNKILPKGVIADLKDGKVAKFRFNHIGGASTLTPVLTGTAGQDEKIREIGNVIYNGTQYLFSYSGYVSPYAENNVFIYLATSTDGATWTKQGKIINTASEDPYLIFKDGTYYLYCEHKVDVPFHAIRLYTSIDLVNWVDEGNVFDKNGVGWESDDVSSPVVWIEGSVWYMLYEGRGPAQTGAIGLATSPDGLVWTRDGSNPVVSGTNINSTLLWAINAVPDGIEKIGDDYYMFAHATDNTSVFKIAFLTSKNLTEWVDLFGTYIENQHSSDAGDGISIFFDGVDYRVLYGSLDNSSVFCGNLTINKQDVSQLVTKNTTQTIDAIKYYSKEQIISYDTLFLNLRSNEIIFNRNAAAYIDNKGGSSSTITLRTGNPQLNRLVLSSTGGQFTGSCRADSFNVAGVNGVDGSYTTADGKTVTVTKGIITSIV
jgi:uncharacterized protein YdeI (BOF family)